MAEGELEQAVTDCHALISEYQSTGASALDLAAVLRLLAKVTTSTPIAFDSAQRVFPLETKMYLTIDNRHITH